MNFQFNEKTHRYTLDGKSLVGVTTVVGIIDKPQLISWASNMAVDYIDKNFPTFEQMQSDTKALSNVLEDARKAWCYKRDSAGDVGTSCHNWIEQYAKSKINDTEYLPEYENEQVEKMVNKFIEWANENNIKFLLSEQRLYSKTHFFAGTVDLLIERDGKKYIADIKTAKDIYQQNFIQMAGYHIALEELGKVQDLAGYTVINIPKEMTRKGEAKLKVRTLYKTEQHKKAFLNCLDLYRYMNEYKPVYLKRRKKA